MLGKGREQPDIRKPVVMPTKAPHPPRQPYPLLRRAVAMALIDNSMPSRMRGSLSPAR